MIEVSSSMSFFEDPRGLFKTASASARAASGCVRVASAGMEPVSAGTSAASAAVAFAAAAGAASVALSRRDLTRGSLDGQNLSRIRGHHSDLGGSVLLVSLVVDVLDATGRNAGDTLHLVRLLVVTLQIVANDQ